jgi:hypothetical protein
MSKINSACCAATPGCSARSRKVQQFGLDFVATVFRRRLEANAGRAQDEFRNQPFAPCRALLAQLAVMQASARGIVYGVENQPFAAKFEKGAMAEVVVGGRLEQGDRLLFLDKLLESLARLVPVDEKDDTLSEILEIAKQRLFVGGGEAAGGHEIARRQSPFHSGRDPARRHRTAEQVKTNRRNGRRCRSPVVMPMT